MRLTRKHLITYCSLGSMHVVSGTLILSVSTGVGMSICGGLALLGGIFLVTMSIHELLK